MLLSPYSLSSKATTPSKSRGAAPLPSTFVTAVGRNQNTSLLNSPTRRSNPSTPNTRPRKSKNNNGTESLTSDDLMSEIELQLNQLSLENQKKITIYQQEKENQRTLTIQQEIKQKEKEFYYYETNTVKQLYEKELNRIQEYHDKEEKHLLSHISVLSNEISQLISDREKYLMKVKEEKKKLQSQTTETEQLEKDMQSIENGILTIQKNIKEKEEIHKSQLKDDIIHRYEKEIQQLQEKYDENEKEMKIMGEEYQQRIQMKEKDHAKQLQQLNDSVRSEVTEREERIQSLREQLESERARHSRLTHHIEQYDKNPNMLDVEDEKSSKQRAGAIGGNKPKARTTATVVTAATTFSGAASRRPAGGSVSGNEKRDGEEQSHHSGYSASTISTASHSYHRRAQRVVRRSDGEDDQVEDERERKKYDNAFNTRK